jgi:serine phosphatase RsbU (regulator of sigma subunit)
VVIWSAALIFGPTALWLAVFYRLVRFGRAWRKNPTTANRWNSLRNLSLFLAITLFAGLVALALYRAWGGDFPLAGLDWERFGPAFFATLIWYLLSGLIWTPLSAYLSRSWGWTENSWEALFRFLGLTIGWRLFADPFAILAAVLYAQIGVGGYLFFLAGLALVSGLAHQLSHAAERGQFRLRELTKLEQLERALVSAPLDASTLLQILQEHVPSMFPGGQVEICLFPGQWGAMVCTEADVCRAIFRHPEEQPPIDPAVWQWLRQTAKARYFLPGKKRPWALHVPSEDIAVLVAPINDVEGAETIGGIYLSRDWHPDATASLLPAVQSLAIQLASTLQRAKVYVQTLAHQKTAQELALAWQIQASFLPDSLPEVPGWQLAAALEPARQTSGDFYDLLWLPNSRLGLLIADVADKGMGSALYMALSRTLLRTFAVQYHTRPDYVLRVANRRILADSDTDLFVTLFYGVLDPATGTLSYCNAGHNPPYIFDAQGKKPVRELPRTGMPLGILEDATWEPETVQLAPDDVLVLYTDGVTEAEDGRGNFFENQQLLQTVQASLSRSAPDIQEALLAEVHAFMGDEPQSDDITVMVLRRDR